MAKTADAVVIGGGALGASIFYYLTKLGMTDVVLLEKGDLASGSTGDSAAFRAAALLERGLDTACQEEPGVLPGIRGRIRRRGRVHVDGLAIPGAAGSGGGVRRQHRAATAGGREDVAHFGGGGRGGDPGPQHRGDRPGGLRARVGLRGPGGDGAGDSGQGRDERRRGTRSLPCHRPFGQGRRQHGRHSMRRYRDEGGGERGRGPGRTRWAGGWGSTCRWRFRASRT